MVSSAFRLDRTPVNGPLGHVKSAGSLEIIPVVFVYWLRGNGDNYLFVPIPPLWKVEFVPMGHLPIYLLVFGAVLCLMSIFLWSRRFVRVQSSEERKKSIAMIALSIMGLILCVNSLMHLTECLTSICL